MTEEGAEGAGKGGGVGGEESVQVAGEGLRRGGGRGAGGKRCAVHGLVQHRGGIRVQQQVPPEVPGEGVLQRLLQPADLQPQLHLQAALDQLPSSPFSVRPCRQSALFSVSSPLVFQYHY